MIYLKHIRIVIASSDDAKEEREALASIIERVNSNTAERLRLILRLGRWETDTYLCFHVDGPQGLVDSILRIEDVNQLEGRGLIVAAESGRLINITKEGLDKISENQARDSRYGFFPKAGRRKSNHTRLDNMHSI